LNSSCEFEYDLRIAFATFGGAAMKLRIFPTVVIAMSCSIWVPANARAAESILTFETLLVGTQYGNPVGDMPGDFVFSESGVDVSVEFFDFSGGGGSFGFALVAAPGMDVPGAGSFDFGSGNLIGTNNVNLEFDFTNVGFVVDHVTVQYANNGGSENISVNGGPVTATEIALAPANIAPGVTLGVTQMGDIFTLELTGVVTSFRIGGQEFGFDTVIATPEPASILLLTIATGFVLRRKSRC
jgi:hypothetical protein